MEPVDIIDNHPGRIGPGPNEETDPLSPDIQNHANDREAGQNPGPAHRLPFPLMTRIVIRFTISIWYPFGRYLGFLLKETTLHYVVNNQPRLVYLLHLIALIT